MTTLAAPARVGGRGLFTGARAAVTVHPAAPGEGLKFRVGDQTAAAGIASLADRAPHPALRGRAPRQTALRVGTETVFTVEHLLSALAGLGVTDALCEVEGGEIPIGDGSAAVFTEAFVGAGLTDHHADPPPLLVTDAVSVRADDGSAEILIEPAPTTAFVYELDYGPGSPLTPAIVAWDGSADAYRASVAPSRTFSLAAEAEAMRAAGLFTAFSPKELLVIASDGRAVDNALRAPDEPAWHKLLDLIGDLSLGAPGRPVRGRVTARRSGHGLNHRAARLLAEMPR